MVNRNMENNFCRASSDKPAMYPVNKKRNWHCTDGQEGWNLEKEIRKKIMNHNYRTHDSGFVYGRIGEFQGIYSDKGVKRNLHIELGLRLWEYKGFLSYLRKKYK